MSLLCLFSSEWEQRAFTIILNTQRVVSEETAIMGRLRKIEVSPHEENMVSEISNTGVLTSALYLFCWLKSWGWGKVDLEAIVLQRREEVKISASV